MTYFALRFVHILGAIILLGTGIGIAFFCWFSYLAAKRDNNIDLLRGTLELTVIADFIFTTTAAVIQPITGLVLWKMTFNNWSHPWLWTVVCLYVSVGLCWLPVVFLQIKLRNIARATRSMTALPQEFHEQFNRWFQLGIPAFVLMLALLASMVFRNYFLA